MPSFRQGIVMASAAGDRGEPRAGRLPPKNQRKRKDARADDATLSPVVKATQPTLDPARLLFFPLLWVHACCILHYFHPYSIPLHSILLLLHHHAWSCRFSPPWNPMPASSKDHISSFWLKHRHRRQYALLLDSTTTSMTTVSATHRNGNS